jgi:hypothetical protein
MKYLIDNGIEFDLAIDHRCSQSYSKTEVNSRVIMLLKYYQTQNDSESIKQLIEMI